MLVGSYIFKSVGEGDLSHSEEQALRNEIILESNRVLDIVEASTVFGLDAASERRWEDAQSTLERARIGCSTMRYGSVDIIFDVYTPVPFNDTVKRTMAEVIGHAVDLKALAFGWSDPLFTNTALQPTVFNLTNENLFPVPNGAVLNAKVALLNGQLSAHENFIISTKLAISAKAGAATVSIYTGFVHKLFSPGSAVSAYDAIVKLGVTGAHFEQALGFFSKQDAFVYTTEQVISVFAFASLVDGAGGAVLNASLLKSVNEKNKGALSASAPVLIANALYDAKAVVDALSDSSNGQVPLSKMASLIASPSQQRTLLGNDKCIANPSSETEDKFATLCATVLAENECGATRKEGVTYRWFAQQCVWAKDDTALANVTVPELLLVDSNGNGQLTLLELSKLLVEAPLNDARSVAAGETPADDLELNRNAIDSGDLEPGLFEQIVLINELADELRDAQEIRDTVEKERDTAQTSAAALAQPVEETEGVPVLYFIIPAVVLLVIGIGIVSRKAKTYFKNEDDLPFQWQRESLALAKDGMLLENPTFSGDGDGKTTKIESDEYAGNVKVTEDDEIIGRLETDAFAGGTIGRAQRAAAATMIQFLAMTTGNDRALNFASNVIEDDNADVYGEMIVGDMDNFTPAPTGPLETGTIPSVEFDAYEGSSDEFDTSASDGDELDAATQRATGGPPVTQLRADNDYRYLPRDDDDDTSNYEESDSDSDSGGENDGLGFAGFAEPPTAPEEDPGGFADVSEALLAPLKAPAGFAGFAEPSPSPVESPAGFGDAHTLGVSAVVAEFGKFDDSSDYITDDEDEFD